MRKAFIVLAVAACAASSLSQAQPRDPQAETAPPATAANASADAGDNDTVRGKSGFGQVMSVLTGLLQEAAARQASSGPANASPLLSSDQSAVTISVTPVAGRSTFLVDKSSTDKPSAEMAADERTGQPGPTEAQPPARVAVTIDPAATAQGAEMAMQADGGVPD